MIAHLEWRNRQVCIEWRNRQVCMRLFCMLCNSTRVLGCNQLHSSQKFGVQTLGTAKPKCLTSGHHLQQWLSHSTSMLEVCIKSARAAMTIYHGLGGLNNKFIFSTVLEAGKPKSRC